MVTINTKKENYLEHGKHLQYLNNSTSWIDFDIYPESSQK